MLTPWGTEFILILQHVKKLLAYYGNKMFIAKIKKRPLLFPCPEQDTSSHPTSLRSISIASYSLLLCLPSGLLT